MSAPKSHGRKSIQATLTPRELMTDTPSLAGVWKAQIITLFPSAFPGVLGESLTGKALKDGVWQLQTFDLRRYGIGNSATDSFGKQCLMARRFVEAGVRL